MGKQDQARPPRETPAGKPGGRFARGVSGNPHGRPLGSRNKTTEIAAALVAGDVEAVMRKALALAKDGDRVCLRLIVERLLPRASAEACAGPTLAPRTGLVAAARDTIR